MKKIIKLKNIAFLVTQNMKPQETKTIKCIDCGKDVIVNALDNQTNRCEQCYKIHRQKYKTIKEKERRNRLKS